MTDIVTDPNPENKEDTVPGTTILLDTPKELVAAPVAKVEPVVTNEAVAYEPTGDVGLDMALDFIGKAGLDADHPAVKAATTGDFTILKATLAQKGVAGWEQFVALGEVAYQRAKEEETKAQAALVSLVHDVAGGAKEWASVQKWAGDNATPEEKAQINALLNQGGLAAKGAVKYLVDAYNRASNVVTEPKNGMSDAARTAPAGDSGALDPKAYAKEVQTLHAKLGGRLEGSPEYEKLRQRRQLYRA